MCNKKIVNITLDENNYVVNLLTNKKMSQKAQKYFEDMRKKAYIKIMLPL
jgi:gamma-glutamyl-gamma-aminobutyrate hydrolase PuuD